MLPKITIITPSYNQGEYIEETILSVINQGYLNLEYIIIDGGSTDNTVNVIKKYQKSINYWVSEKDSGQSNAINKGLKLATGEIINWLNSDDLLVPGALKKVAAAFNDNPKSVMIHGRIQYFGSANYYSRNADAEKVKKRYAAHINMPQPACFFKRQLIIEQGLLDESLHFSMDSDLYMKAALNYQITQIEDILAKFRLHSSSKSVSSFNQTFLEDNKKIFSKVLVTLNATNEIHKLKNLGLFVEPVDLYNISENTFDTNALLFYFLEHRLFTLYNHGNKNEFKRLFKFLVTNYPAMLIKSFKLLIYRVSLFMPPNFLHSLARVPFKAPASN